MTTKRVWLPSVESLVMLKIIVGQALDEFMCCKKMKASMNILEASVRIMWATRGYGSIPSTIDLKMFREQHSEESEKLA